MRSFTKLFIKMVLTLLILVGLVLCGYYLINLHNKKIVNPVVEGTNIVNTSPAPQIERIPVFLPYNGKSIYCPEENVKAVKDLADSVVKANDDKKTCTEKAFNEYKSCNNICSTHTTVSKYAKGDECNSHCSDIRNYSLNFCDPESKINYYIIQIQELCSY